MKTDQDNLQVEGEYKRGAVIVALTLQKSTWRALYHWALSELLYRSQVEFTYR